MILPGATVGMPYSVQLTAANGTAPYSNWTVSAGALPAGLTLNAVNSLTTLVAEIAAKGSRRGDSNPPAEKNATPARFRRGEG